MTRIVSLVKTSKGHMKINQTQASAEFSAELLEKVQVELAKLGYSNDRPAGLAEAVMRLSDFYVKNPTKQTPWREMWCQAAYLTYFLPLNWWRMSWAIQRGIKVGFFDGVEHMIDFGSGLGSAAFAFSNNGVEFPSGVTCVERAREAIALHQSLAPSSSLLSWQTGAPDPRKIKARTLAVFSYSLTELNDLPEWAEACDSVMIVEPATQDDSRRLLKLRQVLLDRGWKMVAPCTHQQACPLLVHSERDWCHDRCTWQQPDWLARIERLIPIKNGTLPFSYLMAKRTSETPLQAGHARITGDRQDFKGFAKQLICRSSEREFAAWQKRDVGKEYPEFGRGELVSLAHGIEKKGNELRPKIGQITRM